MRICQRVGTRIDAFVLAEVTASGYMTHGNVKLCDECMAELLMWLDRKTEPQAETQMKTQNSNLTFEKRTMRDCYNCKRYETEGECIECHYEPKDEPQTERNE